MKDFNSIIGFDVNERQEWLSKVKSSTDGFTNLELVLLKTIHDMELSNDSSSGSNVETLIRREGDGL